MKHLKKFEGVMLPFKNEYDIQKIEDDLRKKFSSEEEFEEWCMEADGKSRFEKVDLSIVASYDVPLLLDLLPNDDKLTGILIDLLTEINFDDYYEPRDGDRESWDAKNAAKKYNL